MTEEQKKEIGRELKVSELKPGAVVILHKEGRSMMNTVWVAQVQKEWVHMQMIRVNLILKRTGPEMEQLTDDAGSKIHVYEYLGEV